MKNAVIEERLLATHISENKEFENACLTGNAEMIMHIVQLEMDRNCLHTPGSLKLYDDIYRITQGKKYVSAYIGARILSFVWNARLSGTGLAVC